MPTLDYIAPDPALGHNCRERDLDPSAIDALCDRSFIENYDRKCRRILDDMEACVTPDLTYTTERTRDGGYLTRVTAPIAFTWETRTRPTRRELEFAAKRHREEKAEGRLTISPGEPRDAIALTAAVVRPERAGGPVRTCDGDYFRRCEQQNEDMARGEANG